MTDPVLQVGDQFMDGEVVVASAYSNGDLKVECKSIRTGDREEDYVSIAVSPTTTVSALRAILALIGITLP